MSFPFPRPRSAACMGLLALAFGALAQTNRPTIREAADAAWALSAQARSFTARQSELDARSRAAGAFFAGPPTISVSHQAGQGTARGARETDVEVSAPLWPSGLKSATAAQVDADRAALTAQVAAARLKLAAQARDLAADAALARTQVELAGRKFDEARVLAQDTERRVKAGDSARIDSLRAQSAASEAEAARAGAEAALARALALWRALTGLSGTAVLDEAVLPDGVNPLAASAEAQVRAARAKLDVAEADRRDPVEAGIGIVRERSGPGTGTDNSLRLSLRVPLGGDIRNSGRIALARAELDIAEAELDITNRQIAAEREAARAEWQAATRSENLAANRERLAREAQELIARSHRLGESDLPARLRADAERFEAESARARAYIEARRALSRLNQANGATP
ncbi:MAG: hypothetical protein EOO28_23695 [Comamonadaceae bacterium]|nr:MAG: hypothetical protein EOO28_23695 [Comamonadaceae bacterium]